MSPTTYPSIRRRHASLGFSTIETLGALAVSLVISIVALVGLRVYERDLPLESAAKRLQHTLVTARTMSISQNSTFTVQIDSRFNNFWIDETDQMGNTLVPKVTTPESLGEQINLLSVFPTPGGDPRPVRFFADGSSDDVKIVLQLASDSNDPEVKTVRVYGPTGQVKIFDRALPLGSESP